MSASLLREASERIREDVAAGKCREPWHPAVALAVADWLDGVAEGIERKKIKHYHRALAVARAYLGEPA